MSLYPPLVTNPVHLALIELAGFYRRTGRKATHLRCGHDAYMDLKLQVGADFIVHGERIDGALLVEDGDIHGYVASMEPKP